MPRGAPPAARYGYLAQDDEPGQDLRASATWAFPQTANAACRREAFEAVGGFREELRAAEDADLTYRLRAAGWEVERRESAAVVHRNRQTRAGLHRPEAAARRGGRLAGARPTRGPLPGTGAPGSSGGASGSPSGASSRRSAPAGRDEALLASFEALELISRELGRSLPNERPRLR